MRFVGVESQDNGKLTNAESLRLCQNQLTEALQLLNFNADLRERPSVKLYEANTVHYEKSDIRVNANEVKIRFAPDSPSPFSSRSSRWSSNSSETILTSVSTA